MRFGESQNYKFLHPNHNLKNNIPENSIQCKKCGLRFIPNKSNQKLCDKCSTYQPIGIKIIKCIDCGKDIEVDALDNQTNRCEKCYEIYRKKYKAIKEKERRDRLKSE